MDETENICLELQKIIKNDSNYDCEKLFGDLKKVNDKINFYKFLRKKTIISDKDCEYIENEISKVLSYLTHRLHEITKFRYADNSYLAYILIEKKKTFWGQICAIENNITYFDGILKEIDKSYCYLMKRYEAKNNLPGPSSSNKPLQNKTKLSQTNSTERKKSTKKGCFIASCVYGSYDCPEVWRLRRYRDNYLDNSILGRLFIKIYYFVSPKLVSVFGTKSWFKKIFKKILNRKLKKLEKKGYDDTPYDDKY